MLIILGMSMILIIEVEQLFQARNKRNWEFNNSSNFMANLRNNNFMDKIHFQKSQCLLILKIPVSSTS